MNKKLTQLGDALTTALESSFWAGFREGALVGLIVGSAITALLFLKGGGRPPPATAALALMA